MNAARRHEAEVRELFERLDELGVCEYVVCAGARNAALIQVVAARVERSGGFTVKRFFDERSAAFYALGRVMITQKPVAVFTTSGTAVAELLPAMVEAYYQALPLIAVTADRPAEYAGSGAPQAIEQEGIFGVYANLMLGGPRHFNVRLEERALSDEALRDCVEVDCAKLERSEVEIESDGLDGFWTGDEPIVVLAAGLTEQEVKQAALSLVRLGAPIMAEATANLHGVAELQPLLLKGGERTLQKLGLDVGRVLRLGAVPSWRWWRDLEDRPEVKVLNVSRASFRGLARQANVGMSSWRRLEQDCTKSGGFAVDQDTAAEAGKLKVLLERLPHSEVGWMGHVASLIGPGAKVFLGNSLPIREWNLAGSEVAEGVKFYANRGANGIDGLISTWLGVGEGAEESWLVLGDLSALYDANALWVLPQLSESKRRLVVINNGGGQIFSRVRWLQALPDTARQVMVNPHELSFKAWAEMWGVGYRRFDNANDLPTANRGERMAGDFEIWEIRPDAQQTEEFWSEWS